MKDGQMNSNDWVAEHVMGFERGGCWGLTGGGSFSSDGTRASWFSCDWCGQPVKPGPCPKYPFPKFTLVDLMRKLGEKGYHVMVRVDPEREHRKFTVVFNGLRVCDTSNPLKLLCNYIAVKQLGSVARESEKKRFVSGEQVLEEYVPGYERRTGTLDWPTQEEEPTPALFANIRDAIKLLQEAMGQA